VDSRGAGYQAADGFNPLIHHLFSHHNQKAAPSEVCDELPAVTTPLAANAGLNFAKT
jgi:hypothetical protein